MITVSNGKPSFSMIAKRASALRQEIIPERSLPAHAFFERIMKFLPRCERPAIKVTQGVNSDLWDAAIAMASLYGLERPFSTWFAISFLAPEDKFRHHWERSNGDLVALSDAFHISVNRLHAYAYRLRLIADR